MGHVLFAQKVCFQSEEFYKDTSTIFQMQIACGSGRDDSWGTSKTRDEE